MIWNFFFRGRKWRNPKNNKIDSLQFTRETDTDTGTGWKTAKRDLKSFHGDDTKHTNRRENHV